MNTIIPLLVFLLAPHVYAADSDSTVKICAKFADLEPPMKDLPSDKDSERLKDCVSEKLYYGIGMAANDHDARICAFNEPEDAGDAFTGPSILMMIYANGRGVTKNIPLAKHYACQLEGAPAELEFRLQHLDKLTKEKKPFDVCDDATSGMLAGICEAHHQSMKDVSRADKLKKFEAVLSSPQRPTFEKLRVAAAKFADERSSEEIDQSGTLRGALVEAEKGLQTDDFIQSLEALEAKKAAHYSEKDLKAEDAKLNELYTKLDEKFKKCATQDCPLEGTIKFSGIKKAQLAWLKYRDAWIEFGKVRYPAYTSASLQTWFTKKRNHMLSSLLR